LLIRLNFLPNRFFAPSRYTVRLPGKKFHRAANVSSPGSGIAAASIYISLSLLLIPLPGIQDDEALFAVPFWQSLGRQFEVRVFHHSLPLMLMSYLGTLKTALYWPLFKMGLVSVWGVRLPMVAAGAITIFLLHRLLLRVSGPAALFATLLLATDPTFLLTNTFDWGPVALEHLLLVAGCYLLLRFAETKDSKYLTSGFLMFGLALWNKALFVWALSGASIGFLIAFPSKMGSLVTWRNLRIASASFLVGCSPFVLYNIRHSGATVAENVRLDTESFDRKWLQVKNALNGTALFAFIAEEDYVEPSKTASTPVGRAAFWIHEHAGSHRATGFYYVLGALLLLVPVLWRSAAAVFSTVFVVIAGSMMILTKDAGGAAHHIVLLWPFPICFAAVALAAIRWRWIGSLAAGALVVMNLLVVNQYVYQFERNGAAGNFTDALHHLSRTLPSYSQRHVYVIDWGITNSVQLSNRGQLPLSFAADPLMSDAPNKAQIAQLTAMLGDPLAVFVDHVQSREAFTGVGERLGRFASGSGYRRALLETIADTNGRPVFEIFEFRRM
jgi:hypothetical protein